MKIQRIFGVALILATCLVVASDALAQQSITYPDPGFSSSQVPTSVKTTALVSGCQDVSQNSSGQNSYPDAEYIFAPFFFANGFPNTDGAPGGPSGSLPFTLTDLLTLTNGTPHYQGSVTLTATSGVYPATLDTGGGTTVTYTISVAGAVVTEQVSSNYQLISDNSSAAPFVTENVLYTFNSTYNIQTGLQSYSMSWNATSVETGIPGPGCTFTGVDTESGSTTHSYNTGKTPLAITTSSLPNGSVGIAYPGATLAATGGTPPYTWSASGLPTGLVVNTQTGVISGTPTQGGQANVAITVTDSVGSTASANLPLAIASCQTTSPPFPDDGSSWSMQDPEWKGVTYDTVAGGALIGGADGQGCTLLCLNYALNFAGENLDPISLNKLLDSFPGDYSAAGKKLGSGGRINLSSAVIDVSDTLEFDKSKSGQGTTQALDSYLCASSPHPVIVAVTNPTSGNQHYVVVTGKVGNDYSIVDPGYLLTPRTLLSIYGSKFTIVGVVSAATGGDPSELDFSVVDSATLSVTAPDGTQTGFNPTTGQVVQTASNAAYFVQDNAVDTDEGSEAPTSVTYFVEWGFPIDGDYTVQLNGLELGTYNLAIKAFDRSGTPEVFAVLQGVANVGSTSSFQLKYASIPGTAPTVIRVATFDSTIADITNSFQLSLITQAGVVQVLEDLIKAADKEQLAGRNQGAKFFLESFLFWLQVSMDLKLVTGAAPQILKEDAQSLLNQVP